MYLQLYSLYLLILNVYEAGDVMPVGYIRDLGNICLIRLVRQMKYFRVVKDIDFMFVTFTAVSRPLLNKALFMYLVFYEYAYLGMVFYSGKV